MVSLLREVSFASKAVLLSCQVLLSIPQSLAASNGSISSSSLSQQNVSQNLSSSTTSSSFSYIIPYNQTQACDIYGPLCQTGSITVAVSVDATGTSTTELPCSSYLTAQSSFLSSFEGADEPGAIFERWPPAWESGFGRSPECRSYAQAYQSRGLWTLSGCPASDTPITAYSAGFSPPQLPAAIFRQHIDQIYECCGNCSVNVPQVRLYYFPDNTVKPYCKGSNQTISLMNTTVTGKGAPPPIAITNGHTFTSPSLYLEVVGTMAVSDQCGGIGGTLTNPYIAIPSGGLSTLSLAKDLYSIGGVYEDPGKNLGVFMGTVKSLNVDDLACPTFGLGLSTGAGGAITTTVGPPYLPIIIPPPEALTLDPQWQKACTGYLSAEEGVPDFSFAIFDPPRVLTPAQPHLSAAGGMVPPFTPNGGGGTPPEVSASPTEPAQTSPDPPLQPQQAPSPDGPKPTSGGDPSNDGGNDPPADPGTSSLPANQGGQAGGPPAQGGQNAGGSNQGDQEGEGDPPAQGDQSGGGSNQGPQQGGQAVADPPAQANTGGGQSQAAPAPATLTIGGQLITANPSNVIIAGSTLIPGGNGINMGQKSLSLGIDGNLVIDGTPMPIPYAPSQTRPPVFTVDGQAFTADPTGFHIGSQALSPGSSAITIAGTVVSLGPSGRLVIGSSTTNIASALPGAGTIITVGFLTFTERSSDIVVDGQTLSPGGAGATIAGTPVSLGTGGNLAVGSTTTTLPTTAGGDVFTVGALTFTEQASDVVVDGTTVVPGGAAVTVHGITVSLGPGVDGSLVVGGVATPLPHSLGGPTGAESFQGGQAEGAQPDIWVGVIGIVGLAFAWRNW